MKKLLSITISSISKVASKSKSLFSEDNLIDYVIPFSFIGGVVAASLSGIAQLL